MQKKEDLQITALSGLGMILVVLGHSTPILPGDLQGSLDVGPAYKGFLVFITWVYSFHVALFFFVSGFSYAKFTKTKPNRPAFLRFLGAKARRLLVPYVFLSSIAFPIKAIASHFAVRPVELSVIVYLKSLLIPWQNTISFYWFLPTLFLMFATTPILDYGLRKRSLLTLLFLFLLLCFSIFPFRNNYNLFNFWGFLHNLIFFFCGLLFQEKSIFEKFKFPFPIVGLLSIICFVFREISPPIVRPPVAFLTAISGIFLAYQVVRYCLEENVLNIPSTLALVGKYSYQIYLLSWFVQIFIRVVFLQVLELNLWLIVGLSLFCGVWLPICISYGLDTVVPRKLQFFYGR